MRTRLIAGALFLIALAGCDDGAPPFDDLPLRDALRADPTVIATLSDDARQRLAARLEAARVGDDSGDAVTGDPATTEPAMLVIQADAARTQRSSDALIVGTIGSGMARALPNTAAGTPAALPPLEVEATAPALTELETRALQGQGAALLRGLCAASEAHHLHRVVGWPTGAVAIGDTVYVGAAWLAALAPALADSGADAGAPAANGTPTASGGVEAAASAPAAAAATASAGNDSPDAGGIRATPLADNVGTPYGSDGGVIVVYPPSSPQPPPTSSGDSCGAGADSCAACAAASSDDSDSCGGSTDDGGDSCDNTDDGSGSDDSCNNTSDGSDDSCNNTGSEGGDDTNCQVSRRNRRHGGTSPRMMLSLFVPLAFLLSRRQRRQ